MILAFPTLGDRGLDEKISPHFGRGETFTLYDTEDASVEVIANTSRHKGGSGNPPELLAQHDIDVMICQDLGRKAVRLFDDHGIKVYSGASSTVEDAIELWKEGKLQETSQDDACAEGKHLHG
ncbi:MAG: NifB/NifX family molybdenum-iron cluster-binding protein [Thermoplasmata archaeon]